MIDNITNDLCNNWSNNNMWTVKRGTRHQKLGREHRLHFANFKEFFRGLSQGYAPPVYSENVW